MTEDDLDQVLEIEAEAFLTPWSRRSFRFELHHNPHARNVVVRGEGGVRAYACAHLVAGELRINNIAVHGAWRRRGVGSELLSHLLDLGRSEGCRAAILEVRPSNRPARALYERHGFRVVGGRRGYYQDTGEDAVIMEKELSP
jgi:ribosomal-protein-alanine N-acetyltransferase